MPLDTTWTDMRMSRTKTQSTISNEKKIDEFTLEMIRDFAIQSVKETMGKYYSKYHTTIVFENNYINIVDNDIYEKVFKHVDGKGIISKDGSKVEVRINIGNSLVLFNLYYSLGKILDSVMEDAMRASFVALEFIYLFEKGGHNAVTNAMDDCAYTDIDEYDQIEKIAQENVKNIFKKFSVDFSKLDKYIN